MPRFDSVFVTGTDTGIGKTTVSALLISLLRRQGVSVGFMKPVETGAADGQGGNFPQDAHLLSLACGKEVDEFNNPYCYGEALSPYLAAQRAGETIDIDRLAHHFQVLKKRHDVVVVEGAGGLLAPVTDADYMADVAVALGLPLLIVCSSGLGTINQSLLTTRAARANGLDIMGLVVNAHPEEPSPAEETNLHELERTTGAAVLMTVPMLDLALAPNLDGSRLLEKMRSGAAASGELRRDDLAYIWHPFTQMKEYEAEDPPPPIIKRGKGSYVFDTDGKRYLDGVSSLWVNVHGHRRRELDDALVDQAGRIAHSTLLGLSNVPAIELAKKLAALTPGDSGRVFYSDSGSTAVEVALKIAFQYWTQQPDAAGPKPKFIGLTNAYHGDTIGSVSVGGIDLFHKKYGPLLFDIFRVESPYCYRCSRGLTPGDCALACLADMEHVLEKHHGEIAAVIIEPLVQGAAGMLVQPPGYLRRVADLASLYGVLLIADEVATGFGRTGKMFACDHEGVVPDIMCLAKGITGGYLPLAATVTSDSVYEGFYGDYPELKTFFHGHTYTGNPLACAVALANLDLFEGGDVLDGARAAAALLREGLQTFSDLRAVGDVRQRGLMVGIELVADTVTKTPFDSELRLGHKVTLEARRRGVIIRPLGDVVVLMPPLSISGGELAELLDKTYSAIEKVTHEQI